MHRLPTGSAIDANAACRGGKQQSKRHETGVVSRVPRSSRNAQASGTDRNTDRTGSTHQPQDKGQKQRGSKGRKGEAQAEEDMRDLNYALKQLCRRNRDGSYATQRDRERVIRLGPYPCSDGR